jgi:hypothetical protein
VETGEILAQSSLANVRGFGANEDRACLGARQNIGREMGTAIVEKLDERR